MLDPNDMFEQLKQGARSLRTAKSLEIIHLICRQQYESGICDFSYSTIGHLSEQSRGPKTQPIRNASGAVYRSLIDAWANFGNVSIGKAKPKVKGELEADVLSLINDSVARILVQSYISENKKLKHENQVLKEIVKGEMLVDMSKPSNGISDLSRSVGSYTTLLEQERSALSNAISPDTMRMHGWVIDEGNGSIKRGPASVFSPGFVTAIRKILASPDVKVETANAIFAPSENGKSRKSGAEGDL